MRAMMIILASAGALVLAAGLAIATGLLHLPRGAELMRPVVATTRPAGSMAPDDDDTDASPAPASDAHPEERANERAIYLSASDATLYGTKLALHNKEFKPIRTGTKDGSKPEPRTTDPKESRIRAQQFIGKWDSPADCARWTFTAPEPGKYAVALVASCPRRWDKKNVPLGVSISIDDHPLIARFAPMGEWYTFRVLEAGTLTLHQGENTLSIHLTDKPEQGSTLYLKAVRMYRVYE